MTLTRGFIRNAVTTPLDARLMDMAGLVCNADGSPRTGVLGAANTSIVSATATLNLAVAAAEFVVSKGKADGVALPTNDGVVNVAVTAAPVSNSRIDVLWVKHNDNTTGDANSLPVFGVTAGTAAASPTKPAIPTGALELATLRIYAGTTATNGGANTVTNTYQMTAARGGVVPFRDLVELNLWTTPVNGQIAQALSTGTLYRWTGAAWTPLLLDDTGWITPTLVNSWTADTPVAYRRKNGVVYFKGRLTGGATAVAFNLPAGFRIGADTLYAVQTGAATSPTLTRVVVNTLGDFQALGATQPNLAMISYIAEN